MNEKERLKEIENSRRKRMRKEREYLRGEFDAVCKEFFPRWKNAGEWKVKATWKIDPGFFGECHHESSHEPKTILIKSEGLLHSDLKRLVSFYDNRHRTWHGKIVGVRLTSKQALQCLLIHEICHSVTQYGLPHGKRWRDRMLIASERAKNLGLKKIAQRLYEEIKLHKFNESYERKEEKLMQELRRRCRKEFK